MKKVQHTLFWIGGADDDWSGKPSLAIIDCSSSSSSSEKSVPAVWAESIDADSSVIPAENKLSVNQSINYLLIRLREYMVSHPTNNQQARTAFSNNNTWKQACTKTFD